MKTLSLILSMIFGMAFLPITQAQYCSNDYLYDYEYYHHNRCHHNRYYHNQYKYRKNNYHNNRMTLRGFEKRIENGIRSGELTRKESRKLYHKLDNLFNYRDYVLSDGIITRSERRQFEKKKIKLDNLIWKKKHNRKRRY